MNALFTAIEQFFFARRSAWPFGLMRMAWATVTLVFLLAQWSDIAAYYSDIGFLPRASLPLVTRSEWITSFLFLNGEPWFATALFAVLTIALVATIVGVAPRLSTIVSVVLLFSFHERNPHTLGGGDTVLRLVGFILAIAPGIDALSLARLRKQYAAWRAQRTILPPRTMPAWPYRLLLWQMIVLYGTACWWKLLGTTWLDGSAVGIALHHPTFSDWPASVINVLMPLTPLITWTTLAWEGAWLLLLIPERVWHGRLPLKRLMMIGGVFFHSSIALLMNVGSFSWAMMVGYLGLLDDRDRAWVQRTVDRHAPHPISVLYDGSCRLCRRSAFLLAVLDAFSHLHLADFRNTAARRAAAPDMTEAELDRALHIIFPDRSFRTGYDAFRTLAWHLPAFWPLAPFLGVPGIAHLGRMIYDRIAENRRKCSHERC